MTKTMLSAALAISVLGCGVDDTDKIMRIDGTPVDVFGAAAYAFGVRDAGGFTELGLELPLTSIEQANAELDFELPFPAEVLTETGFDHVWLNYLPHGHSPPGVFDLPHFDLHFYFIDPATRAATTCPEAEVPSERLPPGYVIPGLELDPVGTCVPGMGVHAVPVTTGEAPFTSTMLLVYHNGALVGLEPMITRELLLTRQSFTLDIPSAQEAPPGVTLPTQFLAEYDDFADVYRFRLSNFNP